MKRPLRVAALVSIALPFATIAALGACGRLIGTEDEVEQRDASTELDAQARDDGSTADIEDPGTDAGPEAPPGMIRIRSGLYVDAIEATVGSFSAVTNAHAWPPDASAVRRCPDQEGWRPSSGKPAFFRFTDAGNLPVNYVSWCAAAAYCQLQGKRLCRAQDWIDACRGPSDNEYPYGPVYDASACNANDVQRGVVEAGAFPACAGGFSGLRDMVGNLGEWVEECSGTLCSVRGGAYRSDGGEDSCSHSHYTGVDFEADDVGIRCCFDVK